MEAAGEDGVDGVVGEDFVVDGIGDGEVGFPVDGVFIGSAFDLDVFGGEVAEEFFGGVEFGAVGVVGEGLVFGEEEACGGLGDCRGECGADFAAEEMAAGGGGGGEGGRRWR